MWEQVAIMGNIVFMVIGFIGYILWRTDAN